MTNIIICLIQLTHQMAIKSTVKNLMGYESMCYEKLCDYCKEFAEHAGDSLKRGNNEGTDKIT